ncbi:hypothetical protein TUM4438_46800 [Shewanella sairae]|uniref:Uncharacterized protein n=1 Tax=Shewanella sairae TaxID=190310 RepID=A0ABQ4NTQ1_9GAMM|nr:hypothetical protein TUM4438_46800 [Shewanella sairae]
MGFVLRLSKRCPSRNPSYIDRLREDKQRLTHTYECKQAMKCSIVWC